MNTNFDKKLTAFIENNYIEHVNLKKTLDEVKILYNQIKNNDFNYINFSNNYDKNNQEKINELIDFKINEIFNKKYNNDPIVYCQTKNTRLEFIEDESNKNSDKESIINYQNYMPEFIEDETKINAKITSLIQIFNKNNIIDYKSILLEEQNKFKKELQETIDIIKNDNYNNSEKIKKDIDNTIIKINEIDDKILILRNSIHKNFQNIDNAIQTIKSDLNHKFTNLQKNEQISKTTNNEHFNIINKHISSINNSINKNSPQKESLIDITNELNEIKSFYKNELSLLKDSINIFNSDLNEIKNKTSNYQINNSNTAIISSVDNNLDLSFNTNNNEIKDFIKNLIVEVYDTQLLQKTEKKIMHNLETKITDINKNLTEFLVKNAPELVFSNKNFTTKFEKWIQSQIKLFISSNQTV